MPKSAYDEIDPIPQEEINRVVLAAQAIHIDSPITAYRFVGDRIELWTCHGGPFIYDPAKLAKVSDKKKRAPRKPAVKK